MHRILKNLILSVATLFSMAALAEPEYVRIDMEIDIDVSAEEAWAKVGDYCGIDEWMGLKCEITSGEGEMGTVRSLLDGRIIEILTAKTDLSYGYTQPAVEGQFYNLYHGFMEAKPVTDSTSKMIYTLMYDVSNLADQAAKDADVAQRRGMFERALGSIKAYAEAD
ncbi:MAG: hypothetical protein DHS20C12_27530 [Pseudohongiella sp.]|nr:MAG: hypothetical protein DHS20C12_27530 [Pseudohongiella sp.]